MRCREVESSPGSQSPGFKAPGWEEESSGPEALRSPDGSAGPTAGAERYLPQHGPLGAGRPDTWPEPAESQLRPGNDTAALKPRGWAPGCRWAGPKGTQISTPLSPPPPQLSGKAEGPLELRAVQLQGGWGVLAQRRSVFPRKRMMRRRGGEE